MYRDKSNKYNHHQLLFAIFVIMVLAACTPTQIQSPAPTITSTPTPMPSRTPLPTWTPTPIPTATPIPPANVRVIWPHTVNALEPVPIEVEFTAPPGVAAQARIEVTIMNPAGETYDVFHLANRNGSRYYADERLQLPLHPLGGYWWVIAHVESDLQVEGTPVVFFIPEQIHFRPVEDILPQSVYMRVPVNYSESGSQGDNYAGSRIWQHQDGQIGLWWAPGPTESLLLSNAVTMLEATFPGENPPIIVDVAETQWYGRSTFVANLLWHKAQPGTAWIIQDNDYWLYVLEIHALQGENIPMLIQEVASTFHFAE